MFQNSICVFEYEVHGDNLELPWPNAHPHFISRNIFHWFVLHYIKKFLCVGKDCDHLPGLSLIKYMAQYNYRKNVELANCIRLY